LSDQPATKPHVDHWTSGVSDRLIRESTTTSRVRSVFGNACGQTVG